MAWKVSGLQQGFGNVFPADKYHDMLPFVGKRNYMVCAI
jgi:hypothetical protein